MLVCIIIYVIAAARRKNKNNTSNKFNRENIKEDGKNSLIRPMHE